MLCTSCGLLGTRPDLSTPGLDGRACIVGIIDSTEAAILRATNPAIKAGDFVFTPACASQYGDDILNEVYELTR